MLRFHGLLSTGLSVAFVAPLVTQSAPEVANPALDPDSLQQRLEQTETELAHLKELRARILAEDVSAAVELRRVTEPGTLSNQDAEREAESLRLEIASLEHGLDRVHLDQLIDNAPTVIASPEPTSSGDASTVAPQLPADSEPQPNGSNAQASEDSTPASSGDAPASEASITRPKQPALTPALSEASAFQRARATYFAGDHLASLDAFKALPQTADTRYWRARCMERLGRDAEALALYEEVAADPDAGAVAGPAREGADFLTWRRQLEQSAKETVERSRRVGDLK